MKPGQVILILLGNISQVLDSPFPNLNSGKVSIRNHRSCAEAIQLPIERVRVKWCYMFGKVQQGDHAIVQGDHQGPMGDHGRPWQRGHNTLCNRSISCSGHFFTQMAKLLMNNLKEKVEQSKVYFFKTYWRLLQFCNIHLAINFFQRFTRLPPFPVGRKCVILKVWKLLIDNSMQNRASHRSHRQQQCEQYIQV